MIESIKIRVGDAVIELPIEEAKSLHAQLDELFGKHKITEIIKKNLPPMIPFNNAPDPPVKPISPETPEPKYYVWCNGHATEVGPWHRALFRD